MTTGAQKDGLSLEDQFFLRIATKNGLIGEADARRAETGVLRTGERLERVLIQLELLDEHQVERVREAMAASQVMRLDSLYSDILLSQGSVSQEQLLDAMEEQRRQRFRVRIGNLLLERGVVSPDLHRAVISQVIVRVKELGPAAYGSGPVPQASGPSVASTTSSPGVAPPPTVPPGTKMAETQEIPTQPLFSRSSALFHLEELSQRAGEAADADEKLMISAVKIRLDSEDGEASDGLFLDSGLQDSVARWAKSTGPESSFVLDRLDLGGSESDEFEPDTYLARKRMRTRALRVSLAALTIGVLGTGIVVVVGVTQNRGALAEVRDLIAEAARASDDPARQQELYRRAGDQLRGVGGLGVGADTRRELGERAQWGLLRAEVNAQFKAGNPAEAKVLLERRVAEVPGSAKKEHQELLHRARRAQHLLAAEAAEKREDWGSAVFEYREATRTPLGDPGGAAQNRLDTIKARLSKAMDKAYQDARKSLEATDQARFFRLAKQIKDLFNEDRGAKEKLEDLEYLRAMRRGQELFDRNEVRQAQTKFEAARKLRPGNREVLMWVQRCLDREELGKQLKAAAVARDEGRLSDAIKAYKRARKFAGASLRRKIDEAVAECRGQQNRRIERSEQRQRYKACIDALKASRIESAIPKVKSLVNDGAGRRARTLLEFAKKLRGMVYVDSGSFVMGSKPGGDAEPDEMPQHRVELSAYFIDKTEVTNTEYARFLASKPAGIKKPPYWNFPVRQPGGAVKKSFDPELKAHPVVQVTWREARAYARWRGGRLPSEAQWEKAARGRNGQLYPWGARRAVKAHILISPRALRLRRHKTAPVGTHGDDLSPFRVFDMAGNVNEWTRSRYLPYPGAPASLRLKRDRRVVRGGAYRWPYREARCAARDAAPEVDYRSPHIGFRIVIEVPAGIPALRGK